MNETTIIEKRPTINGHQENKKEGSAWKQVSLGGISGILMGAGLMYGSQALAKESDVEDVSSVEAPDAGDTSYTLENGLKVAAVSDDLSFGEAFEQARAEVGPGGVFHWHGGIYNTYSADEWNAMTIEQKHDFAHQVQPEVHPDELSTPTDANTQVVVVHHVYRHEDAPAVQDVHQATDERNDVQIVEERIARNFDMGDDVHIVGYANAEGHLVVGYDTDNDGMADVAIIDMDDNGTPSDPDIILDDDGHMARLGDLVDESDPCQEASMGEPDMSADMNDDSDGVLLMDL